MAAYPAGRVANAPLWPGTWHERSADMVQADLKAADIPFVVETPDGLRFADFHVLRHIHLPAR
ncbi:hypothetical protein [Limnoglobus roseus]|uniref:Uncharacterized protein n=1 Tax=Limnoglobus roseus TaxID=2598579 RepID=A0A5C1AB35_9BACT|nr:hypothetical protein [Limnoglobus roseus]QEL16441.1 hypothetical protein PX52LOC_03395 [Limnoglobus roseus]